MLRYFGIAWNSRNDADSEAAARVRRRLLIQDPDWSVEVDIPGLCVLHHAFPRRGDGVLIPVHKHGAILGTLFRRDPLTAASPVIDLAPHEVYDVERTRGRSLVETHWGSYVLLLLDRPTGETHVFRGPMSALPCYHALFGNVNLFFSVADDCIALNLVRFSINWPRIATQVATADYLNGETGLNEVRALDAGACLTVLGRESRTRTYWTPASPGREHHVVDFDDASSTLRRVALACTGSWVAHHDAVLLSLSGGLDSSILLACLAQAPTQPRIVCLNFHSPLLGDEREFARSMVQRVGSELIERERNPNLDLRVVLGCNRTPSPVLHFTGYDSEPALVRLAKQFDATAILNGELGDNIFGSGIRHEVLIDCARRHGFGRRLISVAVDYGLLRRVSVWRALSTAIRQSLIVHRERMWRADQYAREVLHISPESRLASAEALEASRAVADRFTHPWSRDAPKLPAGARQLVYALQIISSTSYESPFCGLQDPQIISPFMSQPLVELALTTPSQFHIRGGQNRALARAAFSDDLSAAVLNRGRGKGGPELWLRALIDRNRAFLKELLLDGVLVRERLLDRRKVELALSDGVHKSTPMLTDVIAQMYIEAWLRRWSELGASTHA